MALQRTTLAERIASHRELIGVLAFVVVAVGLMIAANAIFGLHGVGPSLEFGPDPGAGLNLPF